MPNDFSVADLREAGAALAVLVRRSLQVECSLLEIRSHDEGLDTARLIEIPRAAAASLAEAAAVLASLELHWQEGWRRDESGPGDIQLILARWLVPVFRKCRFESMAGSEICQEIEVFHRSIVHLGLAGAEVLKDGQLATLDAARALPSEPVLAGMALIREWNETWLVYETEHHYGVYSWGTGA